LGLPDGMAEMKSGWMEASETVVQGSSSESRLDRQGLGSVSGAGILEGKAF